MTDPSWWGGGKEPIDPRYERFRDGWTKWIIGKKLHSGLRWSPSADGGDWRVFALDKFDYIDFGVVGPRSPLTSKWEFGDPPGYVWDRNGFWPESRLPSIWKEIGEAYARFKTNRPAAVWNPYDGSWREMRQRAVTPPPPGSDPEKKPPPVISELERRLNELWRLYRAGKITDEVLQRRTLELTREYG